MGILYMVTPNLENLKSKLSDQFFKKLALTINHTARGDFWPHPTHFAQSERWGTLQPEWESLNKNGNDTVGFISARVISGLILEEYYGEEEDLTCQK